MANEVVIEVRVNGDFAGHITVVGDASKHEKLLMAMSLPEAQKLIGESTVKANPLMTDKLIDIVA